MSAFRRARQILADLMEREILVKVSVHQAADSGDPERSLPNRI
jgi:hypothetical protein